MSPTYRFPTRSLLIFGALAAVQVMLFLAAAPLLVSLPPISPPLYAVVAGVHSLMPFLARRIVPAFGAATLTGLIAGLVIAAISPIGLIVTFFIAVPCVVFDAVVSLMGVPSEGPWWRRELPFVIAAAAAGAVVFAVGLPAFSPAHLVPPIVLGSLVGRIVGETCAALLTGRVAAALRRAGIRPV